MSYQSARDPQDKTDAYTLAITANPRWLLNVAFKNGLINHMFEVIAAQREPICDCLCSANCPSEMCPVLVALEAECTRFAQESLQFVKIEGR